MPAVQVVRKLTFACRGKLAEHNVIKEFLRFTTVRRKHIVRAALDMGNANQSLLKRNGSHFSTVLSDDQFFKKRNENYSNNNDKKVVPLQQAVVVQHDLYVRFPIKKEIPDSLHKYHYVSSKHKKS